jgi:hypothetical protein
LLESLEKDVPAVKSDAREVRRLLGGQLSLSGPLSGLDGRSYVFGAVQYNAERVHFVLIFDREKQLVEMLSHDNQILGLLENQTLQASSDGAMRDVLAEGRGVWPRSYLVAYEVDGRQVRFSVNENFAKPEAAPVLGTDAVVVPSEAAANQKKTESAVQVGKTPVLLASVLGRAEAAARRSGVLESWYSVPFLFTFAGGRRVDGEFLHCRVKRLEEDRRALHCKRHDLLELRDVDHFHFPKRFSAHFSNWNIARAPTERKRTTHPGVRKIKI